MREMKDSGVEWVGEIPAEWQLSQTRRLFRNEKRVVGDAVDEYERLALTLCMLVNDVTPTLQK